MIGLSTIFRSKKFDRRSRKTDNITKSFIPLHEVGRGGWVNILLFISIVLSVVICQGPFVGSLVRLPLQTEAFAGDGEREV